MVAYCFFADAPNDGAFVEPQLNEPLGGEHLESLAHGRAADAELLGVAVRESSSPSLYSPERIAFRMTEAILNRIGKMLTVSSFAAIFILRITAYCIQYTNIIIKRRHKQRFFTARVLMINLIDTAVKRWYK
jgi:hypothetical protein